MTQEIYNDGSHRCIAYRDLVTGAGVQANHVEGPLYLMPHADEPMLRNTI